MDSLLGIWGNNIGLRQWWVEHCSQYLSIESDVALANCLGISNVAWDDLFEIIIVFLPLSEFFLDHFSPHWDSSSDCVLALFDVG